MSFGKRSDMQVRLVVQPTDQESRSSEWLFIGLTLFLLAIFVALYVSIVILQMPLERPFQGIFIERRSRVSWAPLWIAPLVSALGATVATGVIWYQRIKPSTGIVAITSFATLYGSAVISGVVKNIGYMVYTIHADTMSIAKVMTKIISRHMFETSFNLAVLGPELLLIPPAYALVWWFYESNAQV